MKTVYEEEIDNIKAKLVLDEINFYLYVYYNDICLEKITDKTWSDIRSDEDWVYSAIISFAVNKYKKEQLSFSSDFISAMSELD